MSHDPNRIEALSSIYGVTGRVVGSWFLKQALRRHLRASGGSAQAGARFPDFLSNLPGLRRLPFLPDLAWDPLESTCRHASLSIL